jgi:hypothetical protein
VSAGSFREGGCVVVMPTSSGTLGTILKGRLQDARISEPMRTTATSQDLLSIFIFTLPYKTYLKTGTPTVEIDFPMKAAMVNVGMMVCWIKYTELNQKNNAWIE